MKYGIDLDGVCYDFVREFNLWLEKATGEYLAYEDIKDYYWYNIMKSLSKEKFFEEFHKFGHSNGYKDLKLIKDAVNGVKLLSNLSDAVYFVTGRPDYAEEDTQLAINRDFGKYHNGLFFSHGEDYKSKAVNELDIDIFIDDAPHYAMSIAENTKALVYLMDAPYNQHVSHRKIKRISNWQEFITIEISRRGLLSE